MALDKSKLLAAGKGVETVPVPEFGAVGVRGLTGGEYERFGSAAHGNSHASPVRFREFVITPSTSAAAAPSATSASAASAAATSSSATRAVIPDPGLDTGHTDFATSAASTPTVRPDEVPGTPGRPMTDDEREILAAPGGPEAKQFADDMIEHGGMSDPWVFDYARGRYEHALSVVKTLDDKAGAIIGYLGGGTGLFTLGSVAAVTSGQANPLIVAAAFPSLLFAGFAVYRAAQARLTVSKWAPPEVPAVVAVATTDNHRARAAMIGQWHLCSVMMRPAMERKANLVDASLWNFFRALGELGLPLATGLTLGAADLLQPAPKPPVRVEIAPLPPPVIEVIRTAP